MKSYMEKMNPSYLGQVISIGEKTDDQPREIGSVAGAYIKFKAMNAKFGVFGVVIDKSELTNDALVGEKVLEYTECYLVPTRQRINSTRVDENGQSQRVTNGILEYNVYLKGVTFKEEA